MGRSKSVTETPAAGTFMTGKAGSNKVPLEGTTHKGGDLRAQPSKNQGKMPKSMVD